MNEKKAQENKYCREFWFEFLDTHRKSGSRGL